VVAVLSLELPRRGRATVQMVQNEIEDEDDDEYEDDCGVAGLTLPTVRTPERRPHHERRDRSPSRSRKPFLDTV
jgi:hypothetical protein